MARPQPTCTAAVVGVGNRALAAVRRGDEYELYRSQWGGSDAVLAGLFDSRTDPLAVLLGLDWTRQECCPGTALAHRIDYHALDAVYLLSPAGVTVCQPVWLGLGWPATPDPTAGVLVRVDSPAEHRALRRFVAFFRTLCREAVERDLLVTAQARALLALACWRRAGGTCDRRR